MVRVVYLFIFYTAGIIQSLAQPSDLSPSDLLSQSTIHQWTGDNGLVSNNITCAIQAKSGFIWVTTYNGIMRFDGNTVDVYDRQNLPFLLTDAFYKVYEGVDTTLWFASQGSGVIKMKNEKFEPVHAKALPKSIRCLFLDDDGFIWAGSNNDGLFRMRGEFLEPIHAEVFTGKFILDITRYNNSIWIATEGDGLYEINGSTIKKYSKEQGLYSNVVNTLNVSPTGTLLIGTSTGLNELSKGIILKHDFLKNMRVNFITCDNQNRIIAGTEIGLARINFEKHIYEFIGEEEGFPLARINSLIFDKEGSLWISTGRNGLVQIKKTHIINVTTRDGLSMDRTNVVAEINDHLFYIGSDDGHISIYKNGIIESLQLKTPLNKAGIRDIAKDKDGTLWIASYKGIIKKTKNTEKLLTEKDGLPAIDMRRILCDAQNNLWFASRSGGIVKFKNDKIITQYNKSNSLKSNYILALEEDSKGTIYVGTHSGGLTIIKPDGTATTYPLSDEDAGVLIFNIHISENGDIWVVSNTGLLKFDGTSFKALTLDHPTKGETYFDWVEDLNKDVWITTNIGIMKIDHVDLEKHVQGKLARLPTKFFDNQDGMKNKECTPTRSILSSSGKIWIPTIGGVAIIYPELIKNNPIVPSVYIKRLVTDKETFTDDSSFIKSDNLRYVFHFTALSYLSPQKIKFKYKLENVDPDWVDAGTTRQAEYTNLKPGNYSFRVIACNNDGLWNQQGAAMLFTVKPFFYQTWWFYSSMTLLVFVLFYAIYKWRVFQVEQQNAELHKLNSELDRFVYSTSHDLRAPLASILGLVNLSRLENENKDHYINLIEKSVKKLDEFINEIIDYSRNARLNLEPSIINFEALANSALEDLAYLDSENKLTKKISVTGTASFYSDKIRIGIVINNLLSNAIKYYNPNEATPVVTISISHTDKQATIRVTDNGIGIKPEYLEKIFKMFFRGSEQSKGSGLGLYIVKETVEKLGGTITVQSKINQGSTFEVILPSLTKK